MNALKSKKETNSVFNTKKLEQTTTPTPEALATLKPLKWTREKSNKAKIKLPWVLFDSGASGNLAKRKHFAKHPMKGNPTNLGNFGRRIQH